MGTNKTDDYDLAIRPYEEEGRVLVECNSDQFTSIFNLSLIHI